jgi:hypothetical protein
MKTYRACVTYSLSKYLYFQFSQNLKLPDLSYMYFRHK